MKKLLIVLTVVMAVYTMPSYAVWPMITDNTSQQTFMQKVGPQVKDYVTKQAKNYAMAQKDAAIGGFGNIVSPLTNAYNSCGQLYAAGAAAVAAMSKKKEQKMEMKSLGVTGDSDPAGTKSMLKQLAAEKDSIKEQGKLTKAEAQAIYETQKQIAREMGVQGYVLAAVGKATGVQIKTRTKSGENILNAAGDERSAIQAVSRIWAGQATALNGLVNKTAQDLNVTGTRAQLNTIGVSGVATGSDG